MVWRKTVKSYKFWLFAILFLATVLRVVGLSKVPPALFGDEMDVGYHAYSLLKTGHDYYGQLLPSYIHSFSEWRAPLLMYVTAPFIGIFGLNEYGVRLPEAFFGILSIYLLYLFVVKQTENKKLGLISAFLLTVSPWHLQYSRAAFEVSLLLTLYISGAYFFFKGLKKSWFLYVSFILFGLTLYTYSTANVFTPLFILLLVVVYRDEVVSKIGITTLVKATCLLIIVSLPIIYSVIFGSAAERFGHFSVFSDESTVREIDQKRNESANTFISKIV